jgi:lysyl-tRNA synthetase class 2
VNTLERLHLRAAFFRSIRSFFHDRHFLEVDTPIRQPVLIPELNIEPIEADGQFLQSSPELCMKRLLAAGCTNIFQICPCFRKNEKGKIHLEEFQMLEWYRTGATYLQLMEDCESLLRYLADRLELFKAIDLQSEWERITVEEAFLKFSPKTLAQALIEDIFDEILVEYIEPRLGIKTPTILYDYPTELGSLAKQKNDYPDLVERFELYINGIELANGFTELTDVKEQRIRFEYEIKEIKKQWNRDAVMPEDFLLDLEKMKPTAGIALGLDRVLMVGIGKKDLGGIIPFSK